MQMSAKAGELGIMSPAAAGGMGMVRPSQDAGVIKSVLMDSVNTGFNKVVAFNPTSKM